MTTRTIPREHWQRYLDDVSQHLRGQQVQIEIAGLDIGDQIAADWIPLNGLTYDPRSDLVEVQTASLDHMIREPQDMLAEEGARGLEVLCVIDGDGRKQLIKLRAPLALPAR